MAYVALAIETILALVERKNGCSSLLPSLLKKHLRAIGGRSSKVDSPAQQLGNALRAGLENGSLVKAFEAGRKGGGGGRQFDLVRRLLRALSYFAKASCKPRRARTASSSVKEKPGKSTKTKRTCAPSTFCGIMKRMTSGTKHRVRVSKTHPAAKKKQKRMLPTSPSFHRAPAAAPVARKTSPAAAAAAVKRKAVVKKKQAVVHKTSASCAIKTKKIVTKRKPAAPKTAASKKNMKIIAKKKKRLAQLLW
ncbi:unnamed protein product [Pylaiella littoralis]